MGKGIDAGRGEWLRGSGPHSPRSSMAVRWPGGQLGASRAGAVSGGGGGTGGGGTSGS